MARPQAAVADVRVSAFRIPTDRPESDGTLTWESTTLVIVEIDAGGHTGLGYTYGHAAAARVIQETLTPVLAGADAFATRACWRNMRAAVRNYGQTGIFAMAISCDVALHDLRAKLCGLPLARLLGQRSESVSIYGSGGFTSYTERELTEQLSSWAQSGIAAVKMKNGGAPEDDFARVRTAREAIGNGTELFVDANGAYSRKQALGFAERLSALDVRWFEEPVSSNDIDGLRLIRDRAPAGMDISAGEYGFDSLHFRRLAEARAVDVLQADATRCAGITGFLLADALADAFELPLSSHTAPALHLHVCCASLRLRHVEWFHDHARIESALFDGAPRPSGGVIAPDPSRAGLGLVFKRADAERYAL